MKTIITLLTLLTIPSTSYAMECIDTSENVYGRIYRCVDENVICYVYDAHAGGGISCIKNEK